MAFSVRLTQAAERDIDEASQHIALDSMFAAARWQAELWEKIFSFLTETPEAFSLIPETDDLGIPLRSFNHHSHRVIYRVEKETSTVYVVRVYHGARQGLTIEGTLSI